MANPLQIQNKSKLIETRIRNLLLEVKGRYERGEIKSQTEYLYHLYHALHRFYEGIGKPVMRVREAHKTPSSQDYNSMILEIYEDIQVLYEESQQVSSALQESFQQTEVDRMNLDQQLKHIEDRLKGLTLSQKKQEVVFRDSFINQSQVDSEMPKDHLAHVWTTEGVLTLQPRVTESYSEEVSLRIVEGNGLPGNTKQVKHVAGELKFIGEESLHLDLSDILDGNADTWFEYEAFGIAPKVVSSTAGLGYEYQEGVKWTLEEGKNLELTLEIELPVAKTINWFSLNPFIPNDKGATAANIIHIEIHDGKGAVYVPSITESLFQEEKIFLFGRQTAKRIIVKLEQPHAYDTEVGHLFYKEIEKQQKNYMDRLKHQSGKRISGVYPSVENLGIRYDFEAKKLIYPTIEYGKKTENINILKTNLFMVPPPKEGAPISQSGFEGLPASRYVMGIRDIGIANYQFEETSEYISKPFESTVPIIGVSLETEEDIPAEFPDGDWVRYSISPDNGQHWYRIHPRGVTKDGAKLMYLFNTNTPQEGRMSQFGYVDMVEPVTSLRLRIELERPAFITNAPYYTPIIRDYRLRILTKGEDAQ